jgi:hypothetical protein
MMNFNLISKTSTKYGTEMTFSCDTTVAGVKVNKIVVKFFEDDDGWIGNMKTFFVDKQSPKLVVEKYIVNNDGVVDSDVNKLFSVGGARMSEQGAQRQEYFDFDISDEMIEMFKKLM